MGYRLGEPTVQQYFDANGDPLENGSIEFFLSGTSTPTPIYSDSSGTSAGTSVSLNSLGAPDNSGTPIALFFDDTLTYKIVRKDALGTAVGPTIDPYTVVSDSHLSIGAVDSGASDSLYDYTGTIDGQRAAVSGYYVAGDGGGGDFYWDDTSSDADDSAVTIFPTGHVGAGRWKRVIGSEANVLWFGAKGDNSTDDTAAIQAAIDYISADGGEVFFPPGTYVTSSSLTILASNVTLQGGSRITTIAPSGNFHAINVGDGVTAYKGVEIYDLFISHSGTPTSGSGIKFNKVESSRIIRTIVKFCYQGVIIQFCNTLKIDMCQFINSINHGIQIYGDDATDISRNTHITLTDCHNNGSNGVRVGSFVAGVYFDQSHCFSNTGAAFYSIGDVTDLNKDIFIRDSVLDTCGGDGGLFENTKRIMIFGSWSSFNDGDGLQFNSTCQEITISGCRIGGNDGHGILTAADECLITGCTILSSGRTSPGTAEDGMDGINVNSSASNTAISACLFYNRSDFVTQRYAIVDGGTATTIGDVHIDGMVTGTINSVPNDIADQDATPSVLGAKILHTANTVNTTITNLDDGYPGQRVTIVIKDIYTGIDFTSSNMKGNAGVDYATPSTVNDAFHCVYDNNNWYCTLSEA